MTAGYPVIKSTECLQNSTTSTDARISNQTDNEETARNESETNKSKSTKFQISPHLEVIAI